MESAKLPGNPLIPKWWWNVTNAISLSNKHWPEMKSLMLEKKKYKMYMQNYTHCGKNFRLGFAWHSIASKCLSCFLCVTLYGQRPLDIVFEPQPTTWALLQNYPAFCSFGLHRQTQKWKNSEKKKQERPGIILNRLNDIRWTCTSTQNYTHCGKNFWLGFAWHSIASKCPSCFLCVTLYGQRPLDIVF